MAENSENIAPACTAPNNNELIVTNEILFGIVRDRHCNEGVLNRVPISDGPEFREAIQETIEFLFQKHQNAAFLPSQKSWSAVRAKYLSTQFAKKWKEVCMIKLEDCSFHWDLIRLRYLFRYELA